MPIHHMLYRCPRCGHDPLQGHKGRAKCSSCGTKFEQGRGSVVIVRPAEGPPERVSATSLLVDLEKVGGPGTGEDGSLGREAKVALGIAEGYDVIRLGGEVLGFSERISWKGQGLIRLEGEVLSFTPDDNGATARSARMDPDGAEPSGKGEEFSCFLGDIRGVQISSGSVQITLEGSRLYQFRFIDDSVKRWEDLLCLALKRLYAEAGRRVVEFKPRVVTEPLPIGGGR